LGVLLLLYCSDCNCFSNCVLVSQILTANDLTLILASHTAATGRLLVGFRKWYYNAAGFNKIGLLRDDTIHEDGDVKEALRRLPEKVYNDRMFRLKRALDLSMKQAVLPKEQWTQYEEDVHYLEPYLEEVIRERKEVEEWSKK
uniref:Cytochrome b-c1 complex subunit 7 n=1 Tax=Oncorhynchus tshawytscha TaxID=74940 RepID=A0AAZ3S5B2_ONCTS